MPIRLCPKCGKKFKRKSEYDAHLKRKKPCEIVDMLPGLMEETSDVKKDTNQIKDLATKYENLQEQINEIKKHNIITPIINQYNYNTNTLQVLCVKQGDDYLNLLTAHWGDFEKALEFVKNCALSKMTGDCKLIEKIYFESNIEAETPIRYIDKGHTKIEYFDEFKKRIIDIRGQKLGKTLASNIQNTYLRGVNYLINRNLNGKCLAEYDIQSWNGHIYELSDIDYQKRLITNLDIPTIIK
jgi:hypothetical protein